MGGEICISDFLAYENKNVLKLTGIFSTLPYEGKSMGIEVAAPKYVRGTLHR